MFLFFFYFYIFSILILGSFSVGPYSIRVYMTVLMLVFLLLPKKDRNPYVINKKFLVGYAFFIFLFAVALLLNGEYVKFEFNQLLLANYLNCFVTFFAIDYFIRDRNRLLGFVLFLCVIILADDIITYLQFIGNPIGKVVALALTTSTESQTEIADDAGVNLARIFGEGLPMGIFGHIFTNANYLATFGLIILGLIYSKKRRIKRGILFLCFAFTVYACFITQERMAFFMFVVTSLYLFFTGNTTKYKKIIMVSVIGVLLFVVIPSLILSSDDNIRIFTSNYKEDERGDIWAFAFTFIQEHFLLGGPVAYSNATSLAPHNFFLNAFIHAGLIGGVVAIILYLYSIVEATKLFLAKNSDLLRATAGAVLVYSAICLFHNASIISGDTLFFILYPIMLKAAVMEKKGIQFCNV